jgi:hypothetical protein
MLLYLTLHATNQANRYEGVVVSAKQTFETTFEQISKH